MLRIISRHWLQIGLILAVFLVFLANVLGLLDFNLRSAPEPIRFGQGALEQISADNGLRLPPVMRSPEFAFFALAGLTLSVLLPLVSPVVASVAVFVATIPFVWLGYTATTPQPLIPMEYSLVMILVLFGVNVLASYFTETHKKQQLIDVFGQYVPPEVVTMISRNPDGVSLEGEAREITIMFCDIHDFTSISERLDPRQLTQILNAIFTPLTEILYKHHGTIDKYMGDAIMAFWGAPLDDPDHARNAVNAAFEMQATIRDLEDGFRARGWPAIRMGIGINTGIANVGNMGSSYRMAYTVLGDTVNLAARLETLTRTYRAPIIVGEATAAAVPDMVYREVDLVQVKGKNAQTRIFQPLCPRQEAGESLRERLDLHRKAMQCYYQRDWDQAAELFRELQRIEPDGYANYLFLDRISAFREHPPPDDWRGATVYG